MKIMSTSPRMSFPSNCFAALDKPWNWQSRLETQDQTNWILQKGIGSTLGSGPQRNGATS
jgi:hypothetical protein